MNESPASFEGLENYLRVSSLSPEKMKLIKDKLGKKLTVAFLVTSTFDIHIGITGQHKDLYANLPIDTVTMEKGRIMGSSKKITWETSDNQRNINISSSDLEKLRNAIRQKINDFLDLDYYLQ